MWWGCHVIDGCQNEARSTPFILVLVLIFVKVDYTWLGKKNTLHKASKYFGIDALRYSTPLGDIY